MTLTKFEKNVTHYNVLKILEIVDFYFFHVIFLKIDVSQLWTTDPCSTGKNTLEMTIDASTNFFYICMCVI